MMKTKLAGALNKAKWYAAAAVTCFLRHILFILRADILPIDYGMCFGILLLVLCAAWDCFTWTDAADAVLYSAIGLLVFAVRNTARMFTGFVPRYFFLCVVPVYVASALLFVFYSLQKRRFRSLRLLYDLIHRDHITSIGRMSEILGMKKEKTALYLKELMREKRLENAEIDEAHGELLLRESIWARQIVVCDSCGAVLTVNHGHTLVCEYCGGALKAAKKNRD